MTVYVDKAKNVYGRMLMCHLVADTIEELHSMAASIGVKRKWFQVKSHPHYDICQSKRKLAIKNGAVEIGNRELVNLIRKYRNEKL